MKEVRIVQSQEEALKLIEQGYVGVNEIPVWNETSWFIMVKTTMQSKLVYQNHEIHEPYLYEIQTVREDFQANELQNNGWDLWKVLNNYDGENYWNEFVLVKISENTAKQDIDQKMLSLQTAFNKKIAEMSRHFEGRMQYELRRAEILAVAEAYKVTSLTDSRIEKMINWENYSLGVIIKNLRQISIKYQILDSAKELGLYVSDKDAWYHAYQVIRNNQTIQQIMDSLISENTDQEETKQASASPESEISPPENGEDENAEEHDTQATVKGISKEEAQCYLEKIPVEAKIKGMLKKTLAALAHDIGLENIEKFNVHKLRSAIAYRQAELVQIINS